MFIIQLFWFNATERENKFSLCQPDFAGYYLLGDIGQRHAKAERDFSQSHLQTKNTKAWRGPNSHINQKERLHPTHLMDCRLGD
uniref:Uncharacterized protein n=1 Tax=Pyxicephalus adspersus TaxID=30357 RepID=A0AAV2ZM94_PYXAD|nr:TPA: hypothetical protein GDO54_004278 [Pyxicephalus adspersus]